MSPDEIFIAEMSRLAGFGSFLGDQLGGGNENEQEMIEHNPNEKEEQQLFHDTLDSLGAKDLYDDEETIMGLWMKLRENDPSLLGQFEQFIGKITQEIRRSKLDHRSIEAALQSKSSVHESEIKKLYDEMEQQIKAEKAKVLAQVNRSPSTDRRRRFSLSLAVQEKLKERELREQMERELRSKEQQLTDVTKRQSDLEMKLLRLNLNESETKNENERLQKVRFSPLLLWTNLPLLGKSSTGRTTARNHSKSRRIEKLHFSIAKSDEERETRSSEVSLLL